jgi:subtilase family serine protease
MPYNPVERKIMFRNADLRSRILSVAVASALGVTGMAVAAAPAGGRSATTPLVRAHAPVATAPAASAGANFSVLTRATLLNRGDVVQNAVALSKPVDVSVVLNLRDDAGMKAAIAAAHAGNGPRVMSKAQLQNHLPTQAQAQAVANYLKGAGFTKVSIAPNRMIVHATGSAAAVQSAFQTSLVNVRTKDGRNAFANSAPIHIPASLKGTVQAVLGLQTVHMAHTYDRVTVQGHYPQEFADIYGASALPPATDVNAAVWGWGSMQNTVNDLDDFMNNTGLDAGTVTVVCTDYDGYNSGTVSSTDPTCQNYDEGETEWSMDSQSILAMSGGLASLTFYAAYGGYNTSITTALNEIVTPTAGEPMAQVINGSFGECERYEDANQGGDGSAQADDALFQLAAAQGQTFSISTGDSSADECGDGQMDSASYPASSPWVVAVSGTTLRASSTTWARENVWLGAGGSPSSFEMAQDWQSPLTYGTYAGMRGPDVAFDANPSSGELVLLQGSYHQIGGTSLAAPLFAGSWARILEGNPDLGFAAPNLYTLPAAVLHDVRAGNNRGYVAKPGWDWATGLGSFDVGRAAAMLAPAQ